MKKYSKSIIAILLVVVVAMTTAVFTVMTASAANDAHTISKNNLTYTVSVTQNSKNIVDLKLMDKNTGVALIVSTSGLSMPYNHIFYIDGKQVQSATSSAYSLNLSVGTYNVKVITSQTASQALLATLTITEGSVPQTEAPTEAQTEAPTQVATADYVIGDSNLDSIVDITDATDIQRHLAKLSVLAGTAFIAADVDEDGIISVVDVTNIQLHLASLGTNTRCGEKVVVAQTPTEVPTEKPTIDPKLPVFTSAQLYNLGMTAGSGSVEAAKSYCYANMNEILTGTTVERTQVLYITLYQLYYGVFPDGITQIPA